MRIVALLLCTLGLLGSGCVHHRVLKRAAGPGAFRSANATLSHRSGELLMQSGQVFRWRDISMAPDSTFGSPVGAGARDAPTAVPTERVQEVTVRSRWRGALEGAVIGAGVGVILGAMGGRESCSNKQPLCLNTWTEVLLMSGTSGATVGAVAGSIRGSRIKFQIR